MRTRENAVENKQELSALQRPLTGVGKLRDLVFVILISILISLGFCNYFSAWDADSWRQPWFILEDIPLLGGYFRAVADGDMGPLQSHLIHRLNAPFGARWYDFPTTEELLYLLGGLLTRAFGFFTAYNLCLYLAHLSAGVSLYAAARCLGSARGPAALCALSFGLSRYLFVRDAVHINLTYCWHLPFQWVLCWILWRHGKPLPGQWKWALLLSFLCAWQHPYYWFFFLLLLFPCGLKWLLRGGWRGALPIVLLTASSVGFLCLAQLDTFLGRFRWGKAAVPFRRSIDENVLYGLRLPELYLPYTHHFPALDEYATRSYYQSMAVHGMEMDSAYLGWLGLLAGLILLGRGGYKLYRGRPVSYPFWMTLWLVAVTLPGGLNMVAGSFGVLLLRCGNRISVLLLAGWLLYLALFLTRRGWFQKAWTALPFLLGAVLINFDSAPPRLGSQHAEQTRNYVQAQQACVNFLNTDLAPNSMVFQWPLQTYPEAPPLLKMAHYEQMVGFLIDEKLRYSYGNGVGQPTSEWQRHLPQGDPEALAHQVEEYGFSALWLYRKGLTDEERQLWKNWKRQPDFESIEADAAIYLLKPVSQPKLPPEMPVLTFDAKFFNIETLKENYWRWSFGRAFVSIWVPKGQQCTFYSKLQAHHDGQIIEISVDGKLHSREPVPCPPNFLRLELPLSGGQHKINFVPLGGLPGSLADGNRVTYRLLDWELRP